MRLNSSESWRHGTAGLLVVGLLLWAGAADARTEVLRWTHNAPAELGGFKVYWGTSPGQYDQAVDVGLPGASGGIYSHSLAVPDGETAYLIMTAYDGDRLESLPTPEVQRAPDPGEDPPAEDPPAEDPPAEDPPAEDPPGGGDDPPGGDAALTEDFQARPLGSALPGWIDTQAWNSLQVDDSLFQVADLAGNRVLATSSSQTDIHSHYALTGSHGWADYEVRGRMRATSTASRLGVSAYSGFPGEATLYRLSTAWQTGEFELHGLPWKDKSPAPSCTSKGTGVVLATNVWYRYRLQVENGSGANAIRAKVWVDGASEPSGWQASCSDTASTRRSSGTIGVWSGQVGTKYWDDFEVLPLDPAPGTGGAPPPDEEPPPDDEPELTVPGTPTIVLD